MWKVAAAAALVAVSAFGGVAYASQPVAPVVGVVVEDLRPPLVAQVPADPEVGQWVCLEALEGLPAECAQWDGEDWSSETPYDEFSGTPLDTYEF
jgi:hypothetical protein